MATLPTGIVSDIQRFSIHDGPGIRTTVFLKGCNLRCYWCHNPETLRPDLEVQEFPEKCIACGACLDACGTGARRINNGHRIYERSLCVACGDCARVCYAGALVVAGRKMTVEEVFKEIDQDREFYRSSGGGVTLSGGEPLFQCEFAKELLRRCRNGGICTAIETNLAWGWERIANVLPFVDLVMLDIKTTDDARHGEATGVGCQRILENVERLNQTGIPFVVRTPVIPGFNDDANTIAAVALRIAKARNLLYYELLPFHPLAGGKYESLGIENRTAALKRPPMEIMRMLADAASGMGLQVRISGEPFHLVP